MLVLLHVVFVDVLSRIVVYTLLLVFFYIVYCFFFFFFKQKTAYEIGTGDWSSDVCSSDLFLGQLLLSKLTRFNAGFP